MNPPRRKQRGIEPSTLKSSGFSGNHIRANVSFIITVPVTADLDGIKTVNGALLIVGSQSVAHATTVNGEIKAIDLADETSLRTDNGSIRIVRNSN